MYYRKIIRRKNMLVEIIGWVYGILTVIFLVYAATWNVSWLYYAVKCGNVRQCRRRDCCFSDYCDKHKDVLTEEEIRILYDMLARLKSQGKTA